MLLLLLPKLWWAMMEQGLTGSRGARGVGYAGGAGGAGVAKGAGGTEGTGEEKFLTGAQGA